jgi:PAS domain S-box-containing protein
MSQKKSLPLAQVLQRLVLLRLFLPLGALGVIVIGGVGYLGEQTLETQQQQMAQSMARIVDHYLDQAVRTLDAVARVAEVTPPEDLATVMQSTWEAYGYFDTLYYLDARGRIGLLVPPDPRYLGLDMSNLPYFQQAEEGENPVISRPFISLRTGNPTVYLVRQLSRGGQVVGELSLASLQDEITHCRGANQDVIFIMDQSGMLLAHPSSSLVKQQTNQGNLEIFRRGLGGDATLVYEYAGTMVLGSAARVERAGWVVVDQVPVSASLRPYAWALGLAFLASLAIWLALAWSLRNQLEWHVAIPLTQLSRGTGALANGDFGRGKALASIPVTFAELTALATDFQHMSDALEARQVALQESEERYRFITEKMADAVWLMDMDFKPTFISSSATRMFGYTLEELQTLSLDELLAPESLESTMKTIATELSPQTFAPRPYERSVTVELEFRCKDGSLTWSENTITLLRDSAGHPTGFMGVGRDITERKRAERALQDSEARYRAIVEAFDGLIYVCSPDYRVEFMNERFIERTGYDGTGELCYKALHDLKSICPWCVNERVFKGETVRWEVLSPKDNRWYYIVNTPIYHADGSMSKQAMILDITKRRQAEEELRKHRDHLEDLVQERTAELVLAKEQALEARRIAESNAQAAEAANQAKSIFLASMSHELRTPLNAILGYAQILQRRPLDPDVIKGLNIVQRSGEHLLTLINDILDIARIETGKMKLSPAPIHFLNFLEHIASIVRARAKAKGLSFRFEKQNALPTWVEADETRLRQVLLNLLDNAIKFTEEGNVTLRVKQMGKSADLQILRFEVQDTGIGIAPDQVERAFQPFEQVGDLAHRAKGTGLGLAISRQLVRLMGGDIHVQSEPGQGSTFWFEVALPVAVVEAVPAPPPERLISGYRGPRRTILVVDDVPSNRAVLVDLLAPLGFEVVEAADGQQAIHLAQALRPDLILMDRWLPVLDGFEAAQRMRQNPELPRMPIVAVSASVSEEDQAQSREAGIDAFLPKPVHWSRLVPLLEEYLGLEWEYEEETEMRRARGEKGEAVVLVPPPQEEIAILYDLARRGNMRGLQEQAAHIETLGEPYLPFARKLHELAAGFEEREILALVRQYMEQE